MGNSFGSSSSAAAQNENVDELHRQAKEEADKMRECFSASQEAYKSGDGARAKELSNQGKAHQARMKDFNTRAQACAFKLNNKNPKDLGTIDLHGLFVKDACQKVEERIKLLQSKHKDIEALVVITGQGIHSEDGVAKIKPAIEEMMTKYNVAVTPDKPNKGCLYVELRPEKPGWKAVFKSCVLM